MRILIVGINYHPEITGIGKYTTELCEWLVKQGCDVHVITAPPYYPAWKIEKGYSVFKYQAEEINGVKVIRCPLWVPCKPSGLKRILHLLSFAVSSFGAIIAQTLIWRPQLMISIEPPIFCSPGVWLASKIDNPKTLLHVQDLEIDAAFNLGILKAKPLKKLIFGFERFIMRRFDKVTTISHNMRQKLIEKGVDSSKALLLQNWVDTQQIFPLEKRDINYADFTIPLHKTIFLYSGAMGQKQGLELLIEAASALQSHEEVHFVICGEGPAKQKIKDMADGLPNVQFLDFQPLDKFNHLLSIADVHLLPQKTEASDLVMPSKLTAMLASGKPIIATAEETTEIASVVNQCGFCVPFGQLDKFTAVILALSSDSNLRLVLGEKARKYAVDHLQKNEILNEAFESAIREMQKRNIDPNTILPARLM